MLPAFPKIEGLRHRSNMEAVKATAKAISPVLGMIRGRVQFEGRTARIDRYDETADEIEMKEVGAESRLKIGLLSEFTEEVLHAQLRDIAEQMARGQSEVMFSAMNEATAKVGNVVDGGGKGLSEDLVFEMFEKMHFSFDERGRWERFAILGGSGIDGRGEVMEKVFKSRRFAELLERKRDEHRRREAGRILVG